MIERSAEWQAGWDAGMAHGVEIGKAQVAAAISSALDRQGMKSWGFRGDDAAEVEAGVSERDGHEEGATEAAPSVP